MKQSNMLLLTVNYTIIIFSNEIWQDKILVSAYKTKKLVMKGLNLILKLPFLCFYSNTFPCFLKSFQPHLLLKFPLSFLLL